MPCSRVDKVLPNRDRLEIAFTKCRQIINRTSLGFLEFLENIEHHRLFTDSFRHFHRYPDIIFFLQLFPKRPDPKKSDFLLLVLCLNFVRTPLIQRMKINEKSTLKLRCFDSSFVHGDFCPQHLNHMTSS